MVFPIIKLQNVIKTLGTKQVLSGITFDVYQGEILGVLGTSGAGKTTLFRTLVGYYQINTGDILFDGVSVKSKPLLIRSVVGFASQDSCFYDELTLEENLWYFGRMYGVSNSVLMQRVPELLKLVELYDARKQFAQNLSGGMKKRLDIACALIHDPKILIMDEPTTGLDNKLRKHMWSLIEMINKRGTTILISSHIIEDIEHLCSRVCMLSSGKVIVAATPQQLKSLYSKNEEIHVESYPGNYGVIIADLQAKRVPLTMYAIDNHKLILYTPQAMAILRQLLDVFTLRREKILEISVQKPSLNEIFEAFNQYYGKKPA